MPHSTACKHLQRPLACHAILQVFGLHGLGGSGKSTLAKAVYNQLYMDFPGRHAFIEIGQNTTESYIAERQGTLLTKLGSLSPQVANIGEGQQSLCINIGRGGKVLIVLDNIWDRDQREALFPDEVRLPDGSIVILTSRDASLLEHDKHTVEKQRKKLLSDTNASQVLCMRAFGQPEPPPAQAHLVEPVVRACHGVPLVLKVVGGHLKGKEESSWNVRTILSPQQCCQLISMQHES